jgi:hypothetical protein
MGKSRNFRPEERSIHRAKPTADKSGKYKHTLYVVEDDDEDDGLTWEELEGPLDDD